MAAGPLFTRSLRGWFSAKGFWLVLLAAVLPLVLTGVWVGSHQADLKVSQITADKEAFSPGETVNITAFLKNDGRISAGAFNATIQVNALSPDRPGDPNSPYSFKPDTRFGGARRTTHVAGLAPGETATANITWTAAPGVFVIYATVDKPETGEMDEVGDVPEIEEQDNFLILRSKETVSGAFYLEPRSDTTRQPPVIGGLAGNASAANETDVGTSIVGLPSTVLASTTVSLSASAHNLGTANVTAGILTLRVWQEGFTGPTLITGANRSRAVSPATPIPPDGAINLSVPYTWQVPASGGAFWVEAYFLPGATQNDTNPANNRVVTTVLVDPVLPPDLDSQIKAQISDPLSTVEEKATIKAFYSLVLQGLQLRLLIPFIALFYAAGVITDEREKGNLVYVLTRPIDRWLLPLTKFAASFLVAGAAVVLGVVGTYALLFGATTAGQGAGYVVTPVLMSLIALFAYGAFFTLVGVYFERPYLVGIAFVLGWETLAPVFVSWVSNLTIGHHLSLALSGWKLDAGLQWLPTGADELRALQIVLAAGAAFLVAASVLMSKREFEI